MSSTDVTGDKASSSAASAADAAPPAAAPASATAAATSSSTSASASAPAHVSALSREVGPISKPPPNTSFRLALPIWSAAPVAPFHKLYCEIYEREGQILETRHLNTSRAHAFGRHAEWCDIDVPKHNSISRQHAAIVHTNTGPVLVDLFSQHGTQLNGVKMEPGRPYVLHEGDVMRLGAASRYYKFKAVGRDRRKEGDAPKPVPTKEGYVPVMESAPKDGNQSASAQGEKRKREDDDRHHASSRKDARTDRGRSGGGGSGLADPSSDRIRCRHLLVKHRGSRRPSSWRASEITCSVEEARMKLARIREEILAAASATGAPEGSSTYSKALEERFMALAKKESDCSSAKYEGDLGFFAAKAMQRPFSEAAFKLKRGEMSGLVETDSGVHIIFRKE